MYHIGYYTTSSPLYGAKLAFWRHHDVVFNRLCRERDVQLDVLLPCYGGSKQISRLYEGDRNVLYPSLRNMNIEFDFFRNFIPLDTLDALYLDDICEFSNLEIHIGDTVYNYTDRELEERLLYYIDVIGKLGKPIILSDTDGFCCEDLEGKTSFMQKIYKHLMVRPEYNWYIISPFKVPSSVIPSSKFKMIPFEVDEYNLNPIKPKSQRSYLCRLVKNMYYNESHMRIFRSIANYGTFLINGNGWNRYKEDPRNAGIDFKVAIPMSPENVNTVYSDSILAPLGIVTDHLTRVPGQALFQYRWKEYLQAGVFIVPLNVSEYTEILGDHVITTDDFVDGTSRVYDVLDCSDERYEELVIEQRKAAIRYLGSDRILKEFCAMLQL